MRHVFLSLSHFRQGLISCLFLYCIAVAGATTAYAVEQPDELLLGIEPEHNIFDQMERYRYLAKYLSESLGVKVNLTIMSRYGEVIKRFKSLRLDGAFLTSYTATMAINELNLEPIVNPVNQDGESTSQGYIFVRKDSGIRNMMDMRGGNIVFVDPATLEGYLFPLAFLKQHGVNDINSFFNRYYFAGSHASAVFAVLDGRADIGAAKSTVFHQLVINDPSIGQELEIIAQSAKVPETTLCIKSEIDQEIREKLVSILLQMDTTPEGQAVLGHFQAQSFISSNREDFNSIEKMAQENLGSLTVVPGR
jgi:phosphonate transport system substrate-binding protein